MFSQRAYPGQLLLLTCLQGAGSANAQALFKQPLQPFTTSHSLLVAGTRRGRWLPQAQAVIQLVGFNIPGKQLVLAFFCPAPAGGDQLAQLAVALAGLGQQNKAGCGSASRSIFQFKPAAGNQLYRAVFQGGPGSGNARHRAGVGDGDGVVAKLQGPFRQLMGVRGPGEEGEIAETEEFCVAACH